MSRRRDCVTCAVLAVAIGQFLGCRPIVVTASSWQKHEQPSACETVLLYRDETLSAAHEAPGTSMILIARLGRGEQSDALSDRRLKALIASFESMGGADIVIGKGERVDGLGRIEAYVA